MTERRLPLFQKLLSSEFMSVSRVMAVSSLRAEEIHVIKNTGDHVTTCSSATRVTCLSYKRFSTSSK